MKILNKKAQYELHEIMPIILIILFMIFLILKAEGIL